jgi:hypothetical protein
MRHNLKLKPEEKNLDSYLGVKFSVIIKETLLKNNVITPFVNYNRWFQQILTKCFCVIVRFLLHIQDDCYTN